MICVYCASSGATPGNPCFSCGKGGTTRTPTVDEGRKLRGGGEPRRYAAYGESENMGRRKRSTRNRNGT